MDLFPKIPVIRLPNVNELPPELELPQLNIEYPSIAAPPPVLPSAAQMRQDVTKELAEAQVEREEEEEKEREEEKQRSQEAQSQQKNGQPINRLTTEKPVFKEVTEITIPGTDIEIPVPRGEILSTAIVTAGASSVAAVAGTLVASALLKRLVPLLKPVIKIGVKRLAKLRGRPAPETFGRQRLKQRRNKQHTKQSPA